MEHAAPPVLPRQYRWRWPRTCRTIGLRAGESTAASKGKSVDGGIEAAAIQAAEPRSTAPLRILVTRQTRQDRIIGLQNVFASLGYLKHKNFDGTIGKLTVAAIKTFQKAHGLDETGAFTDDLERQVYAAVPRAAGGSCFCSSRV